jgi:hypothetical protein
MQRIVQGNKRGRMRMRRWQANYVERDIYYGLLLFHHSDARERNARL